jgi:hypothetical protein
MTSALSARPTPAGRLVVRVQTGVRLERSLLKVLKGLAEDLDMTLGDLLEGVVLHAFEGRPPFGARTRGRIGELSRFYGLRLGAADSHRLRERAPGRGSRRRR